MSDYTKELQTEDQIKQAAKARMEEVIARNNLRNLINSDGFDDVFLYLLEASNFNGNVFVAQKEERDYLLGKRALFIELLELVDLVDSTYYGRLLLRVAEERG